MTKAPKLEERLKEIREIFKAQRERNLKLADVLPERVFTEGSLHELAEAYAVRYTKEMNYEENSEKEKDSERKRFSGLFGIAEGSDSYNSEVRRVAQEVKQRPIEERLMVYTMLNEIIGFNLGCSCWSCESKQKSPMWKLFGIEQFSSDAYGRYPNSIPSKETIIKAWDKVAVSYGVEEFPDTVQIEEERRQIEAVLALARHGVNVEAMEKNNPKLYNELKDLSPHFIGEFTFDEKTGVTVFLGDRHWYQPITSAHYRHGTQGGIGMSREVTVFFPNGKTRSCSYTWRDQYNPNKDDSRNFLRKVKEVKSTEGELSITFETPVGDRIITYEP